MARDLLEVQNTLRDQLRGYGTLTCRPDARLLQLCSGASHQGALNLLNGTAKLTPTNLGYITRAAAFIRCPLDQAVVGVQLPEVPPEMLLSIVDAVLADVTDERSERHIKVWLIALRQQVERCLLLGWQQ